MKMIVVVLPKREYQNWEKSKQQNTFKDTYSAGEESEAPANSEIKN